MLFLKICLVAKGFQGFEHNQTYLSFFGCNDKKGMLCTICICFHIHLVTKGERETIELAWFQSKHVEKQSTFFGKVVATKFEYKWLNSKG